MIPIKNIYYMLSYTFQQLNEKGYRKLETEPFENTIELLSAILIKGIEKQLKQGMGKEYVQENEELSTLRGKISLSDSIKSKSLYKRRIVCDYDEFSINSYKNKIIKSTACLLLKSKLSKTRKKELRKLLVFFNEVDVIDIHTINWNFRFDKNNQTYQMILSICNLIIKGLLLTNSDGEIKLMNFLDEQQMHKLFEKFVLEYYKKHFPQFKITASYIHWQLDNESNSMLPMMKSDIMIGSEDVTLIIDTKYYSKTLQSNFNKVTLHSNNLYQIFTYVKNKAAENEERVVSGMLLYAKTDSETHPIGDYSMSGNKISSRVLDLSCDFKQVENQLQRIVSENFSV